MDQEEARDNCNSHVQTTMRSRKEFRWDDGNLLSSLVNYHFMTEYKNLKFDADN